MSGNAKMTGKDYPAAIAEYTHAIALDSTNPVYYSNRAAAYSSANNHDMAVADAQRAIEVDPKFVKAYHRLGYVNMMVSRHAMTIVPLPPIDTPTTLLVTTNQLHQHSKKVSSSNQIMPT
jgi:tetratricopeptide (TPR) repeat protein